MIPLPASEPDLPLKGYLERLVIEKTDYENNDVAVAEISFLSLIWVKLQKP